MSTGHRPRDTGPIDTAKLTPLNVPSAGRRYPADEMESIGDSAMSEIVIANLRRELAQWRREAETWKCKYDALRAAPAPAEAAWVTWRKEPPTAKEAHECPRWWFRGWLNCFKPMPANDRTGGVLLLLDPDPLGAGICAQEMSEHIGDEGETYTVDNCKGEWAPCVMPP